jgi:hypothetical protein
MGLWVRTLDHEEYEKLGGEDKAIWWPEPPALILELVS